MLAPPATATVSHGWSAGSRSRCAPRTGRHRRGLARLVRRGASDRAPSDGCRTRILGAPAARPAGGSNAMARGSRGRRSRGDPCRREPVARAMDLRGSRGNVPRRRRADEVRCRDRRAQPWCIERVAPDALLMLGVAQLLLGDDRAGGEPRGCRRGCGECRRDGHTDPRPRRTVAARRGSRKTMPRPKRLVAKARTLVDEGALGEHLHERSRLRRVCAAWVCGRGELASARADRARADALALTAHARAPVVLGADDARARTCRSGHARHVGRPSALAAAAEILGRRPRLGLLGRRRDALREEASRIAELREDRAKTLTTAELRLLPLLTTHLSFREIAERLCVSREHGEDAGDLGVPQARGSSRSEAIAGRSSSGSSTRQPVRVDVHPHRGDVAARHGRVR